MKFIVTLVVFVVKVPFLLIALPFKLVKRVREVKFEDVVVSFAEAHNRLDNAVAEANAVDIREEVSTKKDNFVKRINELKDVYTNVRKANGKKEEVVD